MKHRKNSGQILLIAAFIMASLLLSTQLYIQDVGKISDDTQPSALTFPVLASELGSRHVVTGLLANISNGGSTGRITENLQRWSAIVGKQHQLGKTSLNYSLQETAPYSSGVWMDWGSNGTGVSSAYVNFTYELSDHEANIERSYAVNITSMITIQSSYRTVSGDLKQVNITVNLFNEAKSALAEQITAYYRSTENWLKADYTVLNCGNGTYLVSFTADIYTEPVAVSAHILDRRNIHIQANATSVQV